MSTLINSRIHMFFIAVHCTKKEEKIIQKMNDFLVHLEEENPLDLTYNFSLEKES